jgi:hypothetical protein
MTQADKTRRVLATSPLWEKATAHLDVLKIQVMDMDGWDDITHAQVRAWARNEITTIPPVITDYLRSQV